MTNYDFWRSIESIIKDGFCADGRAKLEKYAEQFISEQILYQRFSPNEQYGCSAGGLIHVIASIIAGAEVAADSINAPERSFKRIVQRAEAQSNHIESWARASGCWIDHVDDYLTNYLGEQLAEGGEAHVFEHGATVVKQIGLYYYIEPVLALDRISLHNAYFPETKLSVLGFGRDAENHFQVVAEQSFIEGSHIDEKDITVFAERMGFRLINLRNWTYSTPDIYLSDLHDENVICSKEGNVFVIDCDIRINTPELRAGGVRQLTNFVKFQI